MTASNGLSSQDFNQRVAACLAAMNANYEELVEYLEGINHDNTQIAWDQSHIDAKTKVRDTHHEVGPDGKIVTVYTYHTVNKYSATQIAQWQEDLSSREQDQGKLSALFDQASGDLERLASTLGVLFMTGNASAGDGSESAASSRDLNAVMQNLDILFKQLQNQEWQNGETSFFLSMELAASDKTKKGKAEETAPKAQNYSPAMTDSLHRKEVIAPNGGVQKALNSSNPKVAFQTGSGPSKGSFDPIERDLLPLLLAIQTKSNDWTTRMDQTGREILERPHYSLEDKQRAFLSLFLLVQQPNLPKGSDRSSSLLNPESGIVPLLDSFNEKALERAPILIEKSASFSIEEMVETPLLKEEKGTYFTDSSSQIEKSSLVFVSSTPETTPFIKEVIPMIERLIEETASHVVQHVAPDLKTPLKEIPLFPVAKQAIRSIVEPVVFKAVREHVEKKKREGGLTAPERASPPSRKEELLSFVEKIATRSAHETANILISASYAFNRIPEENGSAIKRESFDAPLLTNGTPISNNFSSSNPKPVSDLKVQSGRFAPQNLQNTLSLADQVIGSGAYSQLAGEGAISTLVRSATALQQILTVKSVAEADLLTDAIPEIGTGRTGTNSINPLAAEVVKEQKQTIGAEERNPVQAPEESPLVAAESYHQILAV